MSLCAAEGLGLKNLLPAYRDPFLSNNDLPTGVCFASGGSGLDAITARIQVKFYYSVQKIIINKFFYLYQILIDYILVCD